jgi:hypothetical protein
MSRNYGVPNPRSESDPVIERQRPLARRGKTTTFVLPAIASLLSALLNSSVIVRSSGTTAKQRICKR